MDLITDVLQAMRVGSARSNALAFDGVWQRDVDAEDGSGFHVMVRGTAWLTLEGEPTRRLEAGDVVFFPRGREHRLRGKPYLTGEEDAIAPTLILCGAYRLDRSRLHPLLQEMPAAVYLTTHSTAASPLRTVVDLLGQELQHPGPGHEAVTESLLDTLLLYILRAWWERERATSTGTGWATALADPSINAALQAMHDRPEQQWTVDDLARVAGRSRAAFARRFTDLVGQPPLAYLRWWRLTYAGCLLRSENWTLREIAERTGYLSEFAFGRAFRREYGMAPGQFRKKTA